MLTMDAVDTFIADCHAALQETSPEPTPRGRTRESQEGGWDSTRQTGRRLEYEALFFISEGSRSLEIEERVMWRHDPDKSST